MKKYIGVDVGTKKTGIAISDDDGVVAFPLSVVSTKVAEKEILAYSKKRGVDVVVVGESRNLKGEENEVMKEAHKIVFALKKNGLTVRYEPEYYSTKEAQRLGRGNDAEAAAVILQSFLERENRRGG